MISNTKIVSGVKLKINNLAKQKGIIKEGEEIFTDDDFLKILVEEIINEIKTNGEVSFNNVATVISPPTGGACSGVLLQGKIS